ncbi:MAG: lipopolysaccharide heptosyltransferase II [candidate division Zixibacteria bacterium]|nr:lipopolysaccharide heptosyltransferase II [candidate division Zixibacteria bacterium]
MSRIAVIQTAFPGDVILCTPIFESLNSAGHQVVAVVRPQAEPLLRHNPHIDKLILYDKGKGLFAFLRAAGELKSENCDAALILQRYLKSGFLPLCAGIDKRVGYDIAEVKLLYTDEIHYDRNGHEVQRCLALCQGFSPTSGFSPKIEITNDEIKKARELLLKQQINIENFIVIAPGSVWATKRWDSYRELAELLRKKYDSDIVLLGSDDDYDLCRKISAEGPAHNFAGKTDLLQSAAIIKLARLAITNDSAPAHIAAAVGTSVAAIFGPTIPAFGFAPYSDESTVIENKDLYCRPCNAHGPMKCPEKHFKCMIEISADKVLRECEKLISE